MPRTRAPAPGAMQPGHLVKGTGRKKGPVSFRIILLQVENREQSHDCETKDNDQPRVH